MQPTSTCAYESDHRELGSGITSTARSGHAIQGSNKRRKRCETPRMSMGGRIRGDRTDMSSLRTRAVPARRAPPTTTMSQQRLVTNGLRVDANLQRTRSGTAFVERGHSCTRVNVVQSQNPMRQLNLISDTIEFNFRYN